MNTMTLLNLPQKCWIFEKGIYQLHGDIFPELPYVDLQYEPILKAHNIPYRKSVRNRYGFLNTFTDVCEYWNPKVYEEKDLSLPLFAKMPDGSYRYCEKNYTAKVPTDETIIATKETEKFVKAEISKYEETLCEVHHYSFAKEKLADGVAVVCLFYDTSYNSIYKISMNHENFTILRVSGPIFFSDWVAIFNMNKVAKNGYLTLQVPKHIAGLVIGRNGTNINAWAREIGVKEIHVVPI